MEVVVVETHISGRQTDANTKRDGRLARAVEPVDGLLDGDGRRDPIRRPHATGSSACLIREKVPPPRRWRERPPPAPPGSTATSGGRCTFTVLRVGAPVTVTRRPPKVGG